MSESKAITNEVRIGFRSKIKQIISQCEKLLKEEKVKDLHLSAVGNSIGNLAIASEILKSLHPELFQKSVFSAISLPNEKNKDKNQTQKAEKLFPRLEIIFTIEKPKEKKEEVKPITEEERKTLIETYDNQKNVFLKNRRFRRRPFNNNRRWGYTGKNQRYAYSAKRTNYGWRRPNFNLNRKPFGRSPIGRKNNNLRKFNGNRENSAKRPVAAKN